VAERLAEQRDIELSGEVAKPLARSGQAARHERANALGDLPQ